MSLEDVLASATAALERQADVLEEIRDLIKGAKITVGGSAKPAAEPESDEDDGEDAGDEDDGEDAGDEGDEGEEAEPEKKPEPEKKAAPKGSGKKITKDDVTKTLQKVMAQDGKPAVVALLKKHGGGVTKVPDLDAKYYAAVMKAAEEALV